MTERPDRCAYCGHHRGYHADDCDRPTSPRPWWRDPISAERRAAILAPFAGTYREDSR